MRKFFVAVVVIFAVGCSTGPSGPSSSLGFRQALPRVYDLQAFEVGDGGPLGVVYTSGSAATPYLSSTSHGDSSPFHVTTVVVYGERAPLDGQSAGMIYQDGDFKCDSWAGSAWWQPGQDNQGWTIEVNAVCLTTDFKLTGEFYGTDLDKVHEIVAAGN